MSDAIAHPQRRRLADRAAVTGWSNWNLCSPSATVVSQSIAQYRHCRLRQRRYWSWRRAHYRCRRHRRYCCCHSTSSRTVRAVVYGQRGCRWCWPTCACRRLWRVSALCANKMVSVRKYKYCCVFVHGCAYLPQIERWKVLQQVWTFVLVEASLMHWTGLCAELGGQLQILLGCVQLFA